MVAKDELLSTLEAQLKASVGRLASSESKAEELAREVSIERRQAETATNKLLAIEERHTMMAADLEAATEALDSYRETLVSAEVRMAADREKVAALQTELRQLHTHLASREDTTAPTGQAHPTLGVQGPGRQGAAMLPPLSAATIDVGSSRVHCKQPPTLLPAHPATCPPCRLPSCYLPRARLALMCRLSARLRCLTFWPRS